MASTTVKVPATTANLGPGYDNMGIALQLYNWVTVSKVTRASSAGPAHKMVDTSADLFFKTAKKRPFRFSWEIAGEVPRSRGLGSSVTVRLGILHGLNDQAGSPLEREQLYDLCVELEGHPDNAAPAAFGGFCIAGSGAELQRYRVDPSLEIVLLIPNYEILTADARKVLPSKIPFADAVYSSAQSAAIAGAFASRDYARLQGCFGDRLHQPYREKLVPFLQPVIEAGIGAGALGGWLSGSGSTVACATTANPETVAAAMIAASGQQGATAVSARVDNNGVRIDTH